MFLKSLLSQRLSRQILLFLMYLGIISALNGCTSTHWEFTTRMHQPRSGHTATRLLDGRVLVVGGFNDTGVLNTAEIFDPATKTWTMVAAMRVPRARHTATLLPDGTVFVAGGATGLDHPAPVTNTAERFDPATGQWLAVSPMVTKRAFHAAALMNDGTVLVAGGGPTGSQAPQRQAERYIPASNRWIAAGSSQAVHTRGTATPLPDGTVLVAGGVEAGPEADNPGLFRVNYSERYDPASNRWFELATMNETPFAHAATLMNDGTVLVTGGRWCDCCPPAYCPEYQAAVRYLPNFRTGGEFPPVWHNIPDMLQARTNHQATLLNDGTVLVTGGFTGCVDTTTPPGGCATSLDKVELYRPDPNNIVGGQWENQEIMFNRRGDHTATLLADGNVLVCGGYSWAGSGAMDSAEIFFPRGRP